VVTDPQASVPELARELQNQVGLAVEHHIGRPVDGVSITSQLTPLDPSRKRVR
jgi:hypothetical protein